MPSSTALRRRVPGALYPPAARSRAGSLTKKRPLPFPPLRQGEGIEKAPRTFAYGRTGALRLFASESVLCNYRGESETRAKAALADYDVIVIGAGNAALAASVSARGAGADHVLVLEKASEQDRGGNTHFSGGLFRFAFDRPHELLALVAQVRRNPRCLHGIR